MSASTYVTSFDRKMEPGIDDDDGAHSYEYSDNASSVGEADAVLDLGGDGSGGSAQVDEHGEAEDAVDGALNYVYDDEAMEVAEATARSLQDADSAVANLAQQLPEVSAGDAAAGQGVLGSPSPSLSTAALYTSPMSALPSSSGSGSVGNPICSLTNGDLTYEQFMSTVSDVDDSALTLHAVSEPAYSLASSHTTLPVEVDVQYHEQRMVLRFSPTQVSPQLQLTSVAPAVYGKSEMHETAMHRHVERVVRLLGAQDGDRMTAMLREAFTTEL